MTSGLKKQGGFEVLEDGVRHQIVLFQFLASPVGSPKSKRIPFLFSGLELSERQKQHSRADQCPKICFVPEPNNYGFLHFYIYPRFVLS